MNKYKRIFALVLAAVCLLALVGCGAAAQKTEQPETAAQAEPEYAFNVDNQAYWREVLQKYRKDDTVGQVMLVRCTEGSNAIVEFYVKQTDQNDAWSLLFSTDGYIGKNGTGKEKEGDGKTPLGDFGVWYGFGILDNPGTELEYIDVTPTTYACDEEGPYYNQTIDIVETGHQCTGEEMYIYTPEYNYGIAMDYNPDCEYPKGCAIFLHCKGAKVFTGGCIAIDEELMKTVLQVADPGMRVIIGEEYKDWARQ